MDLDFTSEDGGGTEAIGVGASPGLIRRAVLDERVRRSADVLPAVRVAQNGVRLGYRVVTASVPLFGEEVRGAPDGSILISHVGHRYPTRVPPTPTPRGVPPPSLRRAGLGPLPARLA
jgi:hypothetical protein